MSVLKSLVEFGRTFWTTCTGYLSDGYGTFHDISECRRVAPRKAILVSSLCEDGEHAPVLDIDFEAKLVPSTTDGHYHLYLDKKMSWKKYSELLEALYEAGIIQRGFYDLSLSRKQSMVLIPGKNRNKLTPGPRWTT